MCSTLTPFDENGTIMEITVVLTGHIIQAQLTILAKSADLKVSKHQLMTQLILFYTLNQQSLYAALTC